jgi:hypothetical protein
MKSNPWAFPTPVLDAFVSKLASLGMLRALYQRFEPDNFKDNWPKGVLSKNFLGTSYDKATSLSLIVEPS